MSIRSVHSSLSRGLLSAICAAPLAGCAALDGPPPSSRPLSLSCPDPGPDIVFFDNFEGDTSQWVLISDHPADSDHNWAITSNPSVYAGAGQLSSDPGGPTVATYYSRFDSIPFSLAGRTHARLRLASRHHTSLNSIYQIFVRTLDGSKVSLIGDFGPANPSWPAFDQLDIPIPADFWGEPQVRISLLIQAGPHGGDFGAQVDNVLVSAPANPSCGLAFFDSFESGSLSKWDVHSDPGTPGHRWDLAQAPPSVCATASEVRSDPAGHTTAQHSSRLESQPFSLVGVGSAKLQFYGRWSLAGDDRFQIFIADRDSDQLRSLVGELTGTSADFPANQKVEIDIPAEFIGRPHVSVSFLVLTGSYGPGFGAAVDDVKILTDCHPGY